MTDDQRWLLYLSVPALVVSLPFYLVSTTYYCCCRRGFADFLAFVDAFQGLPEHHDDPEPT